MELRSTSKRPINMATNDNISKKFHLCFEGLTFYVNYLPELLGFLTLLYTGNPFRGTFTNSVDSDEMPHNVTFYQGLHCL